MTGTRTNRQGAANPLAIEYNKRSEAINGLRRLNGILGNHDLQLTFVGRGKRAADERLLHKLASESEEAEAIARAVCGYVTDHPDDSIVAGEAKRAYGHNDTLLKYQCNGKVGDEVALGLDRLTYWQHLASIDIELQEALSWIPATAAADAEDVASPTLQTKAEAPQHGRTKDDTILWLVENPDGHLGVLHQLTDGLRGVKFFCFIKAAVLEGWFTMPSHGVIIKEFGNIGASNGYYRYMRKNNETLLKQLRETLRRRCQNL